MNWRRAFAALMLLLSARAPGRAAASQACSPADFIGKWSGPFSCHSAMARTDGRADIRVSKAGRGFAVRYSVTGKSQRGSQIRAAGTAPLTPEAGRSGVYRASFRLDPSNLLRLETLPVLLTFSRSSSGACAVAHEAQLGSLAALGSAKGRTRLTAERLFISNVTSSAIVNEKCSARLGRVEEDD
jgi:hypothetical protein